MQENLVYLYIVVTAFLLAVLVKTFVYYKLDKKFSLKQGFSNGGMPSLHSAALSSILFAILFLEGLTSTFYLALVLYFIVISDAIRVRMNVEHQAVALNTLLKKTKVQIIKGHTSFQVLIGTLIGLLAALLFTFL